MIVLDRIVKKVEQRRGVVFEATEVTDALETTLRKCKQKGNWPTFEEVFSDELNFLTTRQEIMYGGV